MKIVIFVHPSFHVSQSMPRYAKMLGVGLRSRGHEVEFWTSKKFFYQLALSISAKKWLGYLDQYIIFPIQVKIRLRKYVPPETLFVFADQALGMWVPLVAKRNHVIHCHDFLAQKSAIGEIPMNKTRWTGIKYQSFIRNGFKRGENFISVSEKTRADLHALLGRQPSSSVVIHNGLNSVYTPSLDPTSSRAKLSNLTGLNLSLGYLLHVGGNQWYKNRLGVLHIYNAWRSSDKKLPLLMIGAKPNQTLEEAQKNSPYQNDIHFLTGLSDEDLHSAYAGASVFLFPSFAEGFGWPIAEAMASGCPVITTNEVPMTEVAGNAGFFISPMPSEKEEEIEWASKAARKIDQVLELSFEEKEKVLAKGFLNVKRFELQNVMDRIENEYRKILQNQNSEIKWKSYA